MGWHRDEAGRIWLRHAVKDAENDDNGKGERDGGGAAVLIPLSTIAETKW